MAQSENILLERFTATGDAEAFSEIVSRHAGLVYGASLRILEDKNKAADTVQETFFQLLRNAGSITGSIPAWLHRVATRKAIDLSRRDTTRKHREEVYSANKLQVTEKWEDISCYVDQAMNELDEQTREILIQHFLEGRPMTDIAAEIGISQPTVSRRVETGVATLRKKLHNRGIIVAGAALATLLLQNAAQAAPTVVLKELGKIAIVGTGVTMGSKVGATATASTSAVAATSILAAAKAKIITVVILAVAGIGGFATYKYVNRPVEQTQTSRPEVSLQRKDTSTYTKVEPESEAATDEAVSQKETPPPAQSQIKNHQLEEMIFSSTEDTGEPETQSLDLSTPEATVRSFTRMIVSGDKKSVLACFVVGGTDYEDIQEILEPDPDSRTYQSKLMMKEWMMSFDGDAEMPIIHKEETSNGTKIVWEVTFKRDFTAKWGTFQAGETMELDATLKKVDGKWLIDNL
jgi:RNA polymerase sigma factor (sigma-70 family)